MRTIAFIFARGGSKGIPRKNLQEIEGKPLIGHAIECALSVKEIERVIVSTDDGEIAAVARKFGAEVPFMRPAHLATDRAPEHDAWQHALEETERIYGPFDVMLGVPTTSPLRSPDDLRNAINAFIPKETDFVVTVTPAKRSPFFNMVTLDENGFARLAGEGAGPLSNRQEAPPCYDMTTVCDAGAPEFVRSGKHLFEGRVRAVVTAPERAYDIDEPLDLEVARFLFSRRNNPS